jgi:hypothetical protein
MRSKRSVYFEQAACSPIKAGGVTPSKVPRYDVSSSKTSRVQVSRTEQYDKNLGVSQKIKIALNKDGFIIEVMENLFRKRICKICNVLWSRNHHREIPFVNL